MIRQQQKHPGLHPLFFFSFWMMELLFPPPPQNLCLYDSGKRGTQTKIAFYFSCKRLTRPVFPCVCWTCLCLSDRVCPRRLVEFTWLHTLTDPNTCFWHRLTPVIVGRLALSVVRAGTSRGIHKMYFYGTTLNEICLDGYMQIVVD